MIDISGEILGNYQVGALLGAGGMGQVYAAKHIHLGRDAALKILYPNYAADPDFQSRFLQEARAAAGLNHPNIVQVLDFGVQDDRYYLVMELVDGGNVRQRLRHSPAGIGLPRSLAVEIGRQTAEGLAFAHRQGIVHRDVKPDNLMLAWPETAPHPSGLLVKITDFGLARLGAGTITTNQGFMLGTPAYLSPEQCQGLPLDGRSDIYSLGVTLYEMTTGRLPFTVTSAADATWQHVHQAPPAPREIRPDIPPALEAIILRCLAKRPDDRFGSTAELATALAATQNQAAVEQAGARTTRLPVVQHSTGGSPDLRLEPSRRTATRQATYQVTVGNSSAVPIRYALRCESGDPELEGRFQRGIVTVEPGGSRRSSLTVTVARRWFNGGEPKRFQAIATADTGVQHAVAGEFIRRPTAIVIAPILAIGLLLSIAGLGGWTLVSALGSGDGDGASVEAAATATSDDSIAGGVASPLAETATASSEPAATPEPSPTPEPTTTPTAEPSATATISPTPEPSPTATLPPTVMPSPTPGPTEPVPPTPDPLALPATGSMLYNRPLNQWFETDIPGLGWFETRGNALQVGVYPGAGNTMESFTNDSFTDAWISIETRFIAGDPTAEACLTARLNPDEGAEGRYRLCLAGDGTISAGYEEAVHAGACMVGNLMGPTASGSTLPLDEWNALEIVTRGNQLWFLLNGQLVGTATDDTLESGRAGLMVTNCADGESMWEFRDLEVRGLESGDQTTDGSESDDDDDDDDD